MKMKPLILLVIAVAAIFTVSNVVLEKTEFSKEKNTTFESDFPVVAADDDSESNGQTTSVADIVGAIIKPDVPQNMNVLIVGLDKSKNLADVNIIAHIDTEGESVKLISLPRDLYIDFREEGFTQIKDNNTKIKLDYCKLTEAYSAAGQGETGLISMKEIAEEISGLSIDHYVSVNLNGFKEIVDSMGGVDFDVPVRMYYNDPYQDLYIDLQPGQQVLDGDKAEQLVRFRKYTGDTPPDKQRMKTQQDFLSDMANQLLKLRSFTKVKDVATSAYDMVKTDVKLLEVFDYVKFVFDSDITELLDSKDMVIVPSNGRRMGDLNLWYEEWDHEGVREFVQAELDL